MKKLIKQDILVFLSLMAAYSPQAAGDIDFEARKLTMQETRDYLLLLRDGTCRICPYEAAFEDGCKYNRFWLYEPEDRSSVRALHLHITRCARDSPEGSIVALDYEEMRGVIESGCAVRGYERHAIIAQTIHRTLTKTQQSSTQDFIEWLKGGADVWK